MVLFKFRKHIFNSYNNLFFSGLLMLGVSGTINVYLDRPKIELSKQDTAINFDKNILVFFSAGNKRLITDLIWIQTLIESDMEHYTRRDLNNWLFLRFNTISELDHKFYENYLFGGQFLAIVKDDLEGATVIYEKGLSQYPDDYKLNFNAGFLSYFEKGDYVTGYKYLNKIYSHPNTPDYIKSVLNKIKASIGMDLEEIFLVVKHNYETTKDNELRKRLRADLYAIKAEIDLKCLNEKKSDCGIKDLDGNPYINTDGKYFAPKIFNLYRIRDRSSNTSATVESSSIKK